jgi:hypothetical protein
LRGRLLEFAGAQLINSQAEELLAPEAGELIIRIVRRLEEPNVGHAGPII